jgi:hypothetical protein
MKICGRNWRCLSLRYYPSIYLAMLKKGVKNMRIVGLHTEIGTGVIKM